MLQMPLFILIIGFIYLLEVVFCHFTGYYLKFPVENESLKWHPIHHHFELCGWSETREVVFSIVTAILCV